MSSSGSRILLFVVLVAGAGLGIGGILGAKSLLGSQKDSAAGKQVEAWGASWRHARFCLVGPKPYAARGSLAIELREATTQRPRVQYRRCLKLVERTERPQGAAAKDTRVERQWSDVYDAMSKLQAALRIRMNDNSEERMMRLGVALEAVDEVYARLRKDAGLSAQPISGTNQLKVLKTVGVRGKTSVRAQLLRQDAGNVLAYEWNQRRRRERVHTVSGPTKVRTKPRVWDEKHLVFGMWLEEQAPDETHTLFTQDAQGFPVVLVKNVASAPTPGFYLAHANRLVTSWTAEGRLYVAESMDSGKTWTARLNIAIDPLSGWRAEHIDHQRVELIVHDRAGQPPSFVAIDVAADKLDWTPVSLGAAGHAADVRVCHSASARWWRVPGSEGANLVRSSLVTIPPAPAAPGDAGTAAAADAGVPIQKQRAALVASKLPLALIAHCSDTRAVGLGGVLDVRPTQTISVMDQQLHVNVCNATSCRRPFSVPVPGGAYVGAAISASGTVVVAAQAKRILTVWRDGKRDHYRLRTKAKLARLTIVDGRVHALLIGDDKLRMVALP